MNISGVMPNMNARRWKKLYRKYMILYEAALRVLAGQPTVKPRHLTEEERIAVAEFKEPSSD